MQNHAADKLHIEVAHIKHTAPSFPDDGERFFKYFVQNFVGGLQTLFVKLFQALWIGIGFTVDLAKTLLNAPTEFVSLAAEFLVAQFLHVGLKRIDSLDAREQTLDLALVLGPEDFSQQGVNQSRFLGGRPESGPILLKPSILDAAQRGESRHPADGLGSLPAVLRLTPCDDCTRRRMLFQVYCR